MRASLSQTREKLIAAITDHYLENGIGKLSIGLLCQKVNISRQAFHRNYSDLKKYALGKAAITEIMQFQNVDTIEHLAKAHESINLLRMEVLSLKNTIAYESESLKSKYITSLMVGDLIISDANEVNERLEKQSLHNDILIKENNKLQIELTKIKSELVSKKLEPSNKVVIDYPIEDIYQKYFLTKSIEKLEVEKDQVNSKLIHQINKISKIKNTKVIIYIDRFLASFKKFSDNQFCPPDNELIILRLPIFTKTELSLFKNKLINSQEILVVYPFCLSEATIKAQRQFLFRNLPETELIAADTMPQPSTKDGFVQVILISTRLGD